MVTEIQNDVIWLSGLPSRFPTHKSAQRFRDLLERIAASSTYDPAKRIWTTSSQCAPSLSRLAMCEWREGYCDEYQGDY